MQMMRGVHGIFHVPQRLSSSTPRPGSTFLFSIFVLIASHHVVVFSGAIDSSSEHLLKFKASLENSNSLVSWNPPTNPCSGDKSNWEGVMCLHDHVFGLELEAMGLTGKIDVDSLIPLPRLRILSFKKNNFHGQMPEWKKLGGLKSLYISDNHFSGEIPGDSFQGMSHLKKLDLANNEFTGRVPEVPQGIISINLSNNKFEGPIPSSLANMDASSFSGNKGLCGKPTGSDCNAKKAKPSTLIIVIIIIAVLVGVLLIVFVLLAFIRKKNKKDDGVVEAQNDEKTPSPHNSSSTQQVKDRQVDESGKIKKAENVPIRLQFVRDVVEKFDLQDLLRASAEVLGSGNFGSSFKATLHNGQSFVVKRFNQMTEVDKEEFVEHMRRIGRLQHPNLLPIVAYYYRKDEKLLVFKHIKNGSLAGRLHGNPSSDKPSLDWPTRLNIVKGVAKGLLYLQTELPSLTAAHAHLKSPNVVLDKDLNPLLMDYSLTPIVNIEQVHNLLVSYKSPEYAQTGRITKKTDVWCLGILILEILTGKIPTNYVLARSAGYDSTLAAWVNSIVKEDNLDVLDKEMKNTKKGEGEILKLLEIGATCCSEDLNKRMDLKEVVCKIEELKERDD